MTRFIIGVLAFVGVKYSEAERLFGVSSSYYYSLKKPAEAVLSILYPEGGDVIGFIAITPDFLKRCVLALMFYCRAPIEGIVCFFDRVIGHHVSKGTIGNITNAASIKAEEFDRTISLAGIKNAAIDEIFQQDTPVLAGVDLDTRFVVMMEPVEDRTGETWGSNLDSQKARGFAPTNVIGDGGTGLSKGVREAFGDEVNLQGDVFHALRAVGVVVSSIERKAMSKLTKLIELEDKILGSTRPQERTFKKYLELHSDAMSEVEKSDTLGILFGWLRECVGFNGYGFTEARELCEWILSEMVRLYPDHSKFLSATKSFRDSLPKTLAYLRGLRINLTDAASEFGVDVDDFLLMYYQTSQPPHTEKCQIIEKRLYQKFGDLLIPARERLAQVLERTHRASSLIENVNGCIRDFMDLKRVVTARLFPLIKLYFNTKIAVRSRKDGWAGTSALERLTGQKCSEFLDIVTDKCAMMVKV